MKIAIEAQRIFRTNKHGMDFVALEAIREIQKLDQQNQYYIITNEGDDICLQESKNMDIITEGSPFGYLGWEQITLPKILRVLKPDVLHCTSNTAPLFCSVPLILTLHDIIFLEKKDRANKSLYQNIGRAYRRFIVPKILHKAKKIITVSKYESVVIKDKLHLTDDKITYIYNGFSERFYHRQEAQKVYIKYVQSDNYIFFLGNTDPKKNTSRTLKAFAKYIKETDEKERAMLLIADLAEDIVDNILRAEDIEFARPYIKVAGYIQNTDLPFIYSGAKLFLYTSLRESFGIPILEAMACACPIITSNTSAIPEIAGTDALLVNPFNEEEITSAIEKLLSDSILAQKQINYGLQRVKKFSWKNTAIQMIDLYKQMYQSKETDIE
jgi:Glycosyltransferase